jgi:hypothetical protein
VEVQAVQAAVITPEGKKYEHAVKMKNMLAKAVIDV